MKKLVKIALILLVAGIIISGVGFAFMEFDLSLFNSMETFTNTYHQPADFTNIEIKGDSSNVTLIPWDDEECKIVCTEAEKITHTIEVRNGTLYVEKHDNRSWHEHIGVFMQDMKIDVYLPKTEYNKLKVNNSSGSVVVSEGLAFSEIDADNSSGSVKCYASAEVIYINASSGSVTLGNVSASDINIKLSSGSISAENISTTGFAANSSSGSINLSGVDAKDIDVTASSGSVKLYSVNCSSISAGCSSGSVNLTDVIASEKMTVNTSSGSVKINESDAPEIEIRTGSGSVSGTLLSEKIFVTDTGSGSVSVPQSFEGGRCTVTTGSGSIRITISSDK